jgi:hypothetical protein
MLQKATSIKLPGEASVEALHEAPAEATPEATDHTSIPSPAIPATKPQAPANKFAGGKGKAGENEDFVKELAMKELTAAAMKFGQGQFDPADPYWESTIQLKAGKLNVLLAKFPKLTGKHEPHVKHPSEMHTNWSSWSPELLAKRQAVYEEYVANWYKGSGGKPLMTKSWSSSLSEEEIAEIDAYYDKLADDPVYKQKWLDSQESGSGH